MKTVEKVSLGGKRHALKRSKPRLKRSLVILGVREWKTLLKFDAGEAYFCSSKNERKIYQLIRVAGPNHSLELHQID
jgi:hypothetical protein